MGTKEIERSASVSNRMLDRPVKTMKNGLFDSGSEISSSLVDLRNTVEKLDPSRQGDLFAPRKLLGMIPFGNRLLDYFDQYQSSQTHLNAHHRSAEARPGRADARQRRHRAGEGQSLDADGAAREVHLPRQAARRRARFQGEALEASDANKARIVREEMLFYTRQKVTDLLTQMAVNIQGYLALDLLRKNNLELIKGVDRATTTTVAALARPSWWRKPSRTQKLVLDRITALNTTTGNLIETTSEMLKKQSGQIHEQAASSTIEIDKLKRAFENVYQTMDAIATSSRGRSTPCSRR